jgi:hypothetical protein
MGNEPQVIDIDLKDVKFQELAEATREELASRVEAEEGGIEHEAVEAAWLIKATEYRSWDWSSISRLADRVHRIRWDKQFEGRASVAAEHWRARLSEINRVIPVVFHAIMEGDISAIQEYVALVKLDSEIVGYRAPTKVEVGTGSGSDILTELDRQKVLQAMREMQEFEQALLDGQDLGMIMLGSGDKEKEEAPADEPEPLGG